MTNSGTDDIQLRGSRLASGTPRGRPFRHGHVNPPPVADRAVQPIDRVLGLFLDGEYLTAAIAA
jgi:hypothetical protein